MLPTQISTFDSAGTFIGTLDIPASSSRKRILQMGEDNSQGGGVAILGSGAASSAAVVTTVDGVYFNGHGLAVNF